MKIPGIAILALAFTPPAMGQTQFKNEQILADAYGDARTIVPADLDSDGDLDVLLCDGRVAWLENLGGGLFGAPTLISHLPITANSAQAADLDGDGDLDIISAWLTESRIIAYQNLGGGQFGLPYMINQTTGSYTATSIVIEDIDGDGAPDIIASRCNSDAITWHRNTGQGFFDPAVVITYQSDCPIGIDIADVNGDGLGDLISTSLSSQVVWYPSLGGGLFGGQNVVTSSEDFPRSVDGSDLDGDGDVDVLCASQSGDKITWYENLGGGTFGPENALSTDSNNAQTVQAVDINGDGLMDVLASGGTSGSGFVQWFENLGAGSFSPKRVISHEPFAIFQWAQAGDMDGDGDIDILSAAQAKKKFYLYEQVDKDCNGNGIADGLDIAAGALDCNGNGDIDTCEIAVVPGLDLNFDGKLDECFPVSLIIDTLTVSTFLGGTQTFTMTSPFPDATYLLMGTASGTIPGTPVGQLLLPLNVDSYLLHTLATPNTVPLTASLGQLTPLPGAVGGTATASFGIPPVQYAFLFGTELHHAFVTLDIPNGTVTSVSNSVPLFLF
jgi:hypothetical protein